MPTGALTGYFDVAQIVLYAFFLFFAGLVFYLRREDKREGYPLESDRTRRTSRMVVQGFPAVPSPKAYHLEDGRTIMKPDGKAETREIKAKAAEGFPGAALTPTGNAMIDGVGAASYAEREDEPDRLWGSTEPKITPMRVATDFVVMDGDPDPRGMEIRAADNKVAGTVADIWVDRPDSVIRYLEVDVAAGGKKVLVPFYLTRVVGNDRKKWVKVNCVLAEQFRDAPAMTSGDHVTKLAEDRVCAYFGGGHLHATRQRQEPLL